MFEQIIDHQMYKYKANNGTLGNYKSLAPSA